MKRLSIISILFCIINTGSLYSQNISEDYYFPIPDTSLAVIDSEEQSFVVDTVVSNLTTPWGIAFLPDNTVLITERPGNLRLVRNGKLSEELVDGVPDVYASGQGGLFDIALHPDYDENGWIYITYANPGEEGGHTALMRAKLSGNSLTDQEVLFEANPFTTAGQHFGGRIAFDGNGYLFLSVGDRGDKEKAQDRSTYNGNIIRLHDDGRIPSDNPFVNESNSKPEIYSYGHRNPQGMVMHSETGMLWTNEHGPRGGDEINIIREGLNYGWPEISYGINYDGSILTELNQMEGMEQPTYYWKPSIAPSGMAFISSDRYTGWKDNLFSGALSFQLVSRSVVHNDRIIHEERLLEGIGRIRDIEMGPDGLLYILDESGGKVLRLYPR
ncbi:MAG: PQQ-dependent sugar dehydrogenase [Balneolales bacterium]